MTSGSLSVHRGPLSPSIQRPIVLWGPSLIHLWSFRAAMQRAFLTRITWCHWPIFAAKAGRQHYLIPQIWRPRWFSERFCIYFVCLCLICLERCAPDMWFRYLLDRSRWFLSSLGWMRTCLFDDCAMRWALSVVRRIAGVLRVCVILRPLPRSQAAGARVLFKGQKSGPASATCRFS